MSNRATKSRRIEAPLDAASAFASIASQQPSDLPQSGRHALAGLGQGFAEAAANIHSLAANDDERAAFWAAPSVRTDRRGRLASASLHLLLLVGLFAAAQQVHIPAPPEDTIELVVVSAPPEPAPPQIQQAGVLHPPALPAEEAVAPVKPTPKKAVPQPAKKLAVPSPAVNRVQTVAPVVTTPLPPKAIPSDYAARIFQRVSAAAANSYPRAALLKGLEGSVSYRVTIDASGALKDFTVEPSGNSSFDKAAGEAIQKSSPFPMPPDLGASSYKLSGIITYRLTE